MLNLLKLFNDTLGGISFFIFFFIKLKFCSLMCVGQDVHVVRVPDQSRELFFPSISSKGLNSSHQVLGCRCLCPRSHFAVASSQPVSLRRPLRLSQLDRFSSGHQTPWTTPPKLPRNAAGSPGGKEPRINQKAFQNSELPIT